ncbi:MAG TPA: GntR family transcriptional regulator [Casimicrobiaceae bacterium]|jgi:DNA-binding GntR family transcriptional regulator|nr:GntR family transcriptional regulator [Casimicrobiaceae bacterium]
MKIKSGTRAEKLREAIEESIATGAFAPGMHLDETELAQRFGVSRTPLREALIQLSSMGIVVLRPRRGAVVAEVTPQRLLEMFEVMAELEAMCGRLAARRMSAADHALLMSAHKACEAACITEDPDAYYHENEQFHYSIYAGSHSGFLIEQTTAMHRRLRPYRRLQLRVRNRMSTSFSEHNGIVEALIAGDAETASERLRQHILVQGERFTDLLASIASLRAKNEAQATEGSASPIFRL